MMRKIVLIFAIVTALSGYVMSQTTLSWQFANYEVINAGAQLQFDVEVKADMAGTFHRDLQVYFDYNTAGFGSSVASSIGITPLSLMDTHYTVVNNAVDNTSSKIAIITEATNEMTQGGSATYFNAMPTTFTGLLRITMDITSNTEMAGIAFDGNLMNGGQYYQDNPAAPLKYVDPCFYMNDLNTLTLSTLYGTITYANVGSTPISNCTVAIGGVGDAYTDVNGFYNYTGIGDGTFALTTTCSLPYTYVTNVNDLNVAISHVLGTLLTGVYYLAGDVTGDGLVTVGDVNLMIDNILGTASGYPISDWVFEDQSANVTAGVGTQNFQGLMAGDADGSN